MSYRTGIAKIRIINQCELVKIDSKIKTNDLFHPFIAHPIDDKHFYVSFFTSHPEIRIKKLFGIDKIENISCNSKFLKFINRPFIMRSQDLKEYIEIDNDPEHL
jgi:hypothetical protein